MGDLRRVRVESWDFKFWRAEKHLEEVSQYIADYRKTSQMVAEWSDLREVLALEKVPHWTALQKAHQRLLKKGVSIDSSTLSASEPTVAA